MKIHSQKGFTLVELAIVLMIIGLLIGGILKGQELINNARITSAIRQVKSYHAAVITFRDAYNTLPGDMLSPSTRIPNCAGAPCNEAGDNNGLLDGSSEVRAFWLHLANANMISGINTSGTMLSQIAPDSPISGTHFGVNSYSEAPSVGLKSGNVFEMSGWAWDHHATPFQAGQIDRKMDDGKPYSGSIISMTESTTYFNGECSSGGGFTNTGYNDPLKQPICNMIFMDLF